MKFVAMYLPEHRCILLLPPSGILLVPTSRPADGACSDSLDESELIVQHGLTHHLKRNDEVLEHVIEPRLDSMSHNANLPPH